MARCVYYNECNGVFRPYDSIEEMMEELKEDIPLGQMDEHYYFEFDDEEPITLDFEAFHDEQGLVDILQESGYELQHFPKEYYYNKKSTFSY